MKRIGMSSVLIFALLGCGTGGSSTAPTAPTHVGPTVPSSTGASATAPGGGSATASAIMSPIAMPAPTAMRPTPTPTPTRVGPVHSGPNVPSATSRSYIPWSEVGPGWHVVLYDTSTFDGTYVGDVLLYLVSPTGTRYEVTSFSGGAKAQRITDVRPDGTAAVVEWDDPLSHEPRWYHVDLATGVMIHLYETGSPESSHATSYHVQFTRPTGENLVVYRNDGTKQWLERRTYPGSILATLYSEPVISGGPDLQWLYGQTGTTVLVKHHGGIAYVRNSGALINEVWIPMDRDCDPVKWWDADTFLAACRGGPAVAPHEYYNQLWLLETNGSAGVPLTAIPSGPIDIVDFGYVSAHRLGGSAILLQWRGDCGTAQVRQLQPDGSGKAVSWPWLAGAHGYEITAVSGSQMGIYEWKTCGRDWGSLALSTTTGTFVRQLVPLTGEALGVTSVLPVGP
jgi:hypothetical protein